MEVLEKIENFSRYRTNLALLCSLFVLPPDLKKAKISQKSEEKSKTILPDSKDDPLVD